MDHCHQPMESLASFLLPIQRTRQVAMHDTSYEESAVAWRPDPSMLSLRLVSPNGPVKSNATKPFQLHFGEHLLTELLHLWLCCHAHLE